MDPHITIHITVHDGKFYTNVQLDSNNFACLTEQPTIEMALAFAMPEIRAYGDRLKEMEASGTSPKNGALTPAYEDGKIFVTGLGWIPRSSVNCTECGNQGTIPTGWADDGDAENGPDPYVTSFDYCGCNAGLKVKEQDEHEASVYADFLASIGALNE